MDTQVYFRFTPQPLLFLKMIKAKAAAINRSFPGGRVRGRLSFCPSLSWSLDRLTSRPALLVFFTRTFSSLLKDVKCKKPTILNNNINKLTVKLRHYRICHNYDVYKWIFISKWSHMNGCKSIFLFFLHGYIIYFAKFYGRFRGRREWLLRKKAGGGK